MDNPNLEKLKRKAANLPLSPGVYLMKNSAGTIIYIGKAKHLKNRVSSYFRSVEKHLPKVYKMISNVEDFDYIVTDSEFECLILEASLIKQNQPRYNILLKDDKGYSYIKISSGDYPRITDEKAMLKDGGDYIGPYNSSYTVKQTVEQVNKIFKLPTCNKKLEYGKIIGRPCLNYHIKQCRGYCMGKISSEEYSEIINQAREFIKDGGVSAVKIFEKKMYEASENLLFEKAAEYRDKITAIQKIKEKQNVVGVSGESQDVIGFVKSAENTCATIIKFREGKLTDKNDFLIGETDDLQTARYEFLLRYYSEKNEIPKIITVDGEFEDAEMVEDYLSDLAGKKVSIVIPQRGEKVKLIEMALTNGAEKLSQVYRKTGREIKTLDMLGKMLGLKTPPRYIEAYDISNFGDQVIVAGMVVYLDGKPFKAAYKKFNIKTISERNDYGSMREVIRRRLEEYIANKDKGVGFGRLPDLILLDGGEGHVNAVKPIIDEFNLDIPVFGMVKDNKHRTRAISSDGGEISISAKQEVYAFVTGVQDEVHRFSIGYSRSKHRKESISSELLKIDGVGEKRAAALMKYFKTMKALKGATAEEISKVDGISISQAEKIEGYFRSNS